MEIVVVDEAIISWSNLFGDCYGSHSSRLIPIVVGRKVC